MIIPKANNRKYRDGVGAPTIPALERCAALIPI